MLGKPGFQWRFRKGTPPASSKPGASEAQPISKAALVGRRTSRISCRRRLLERASVSPPR